MDQDPQQDNSEAPSGVLKWEAVPPGTPPVRPVIPPVPAPAPPEGISPAARSVLNRIASGEAPDYNTLYGGHKFTSFEDHPRIEFPIPGGNKTAAAGLYQFEPATWDQQRKKLGLKDFSPANQDAAAWDLAKTTYRQKTGRDLESDASAGRVDWKALAGQWPSLAGPTPALTIRKKSSEGLPGVQAPAPPQSQPPSAQKPGPGPVPGPEPSSAPSPLLRLALLRSLFPAHQFIPVDYDPWKVMPQLYPKGSNPFEQS